MDPGPIGNEGKPSTGNVNKVPGTGASTPVSVKVRRMEQALAAGNRDQGRENEGEKPRAEAR